MLSAMITVAGGILLAGLALICLQIVCGYIYAAIIVIDAILFGKNDE